MGTFTLTGDMRTFGDLPSHLAAITVRSSHEITDPDDGIVYDLETLIRLDDGKFTVDLPTDASPPGYGFYVTAKKRGGGIRSWTVPVQADASTHDLSEFFGDPGGFDDHTWEDVQAALAESLAAAATAAASAALAAEVLEDAEDLTGIATTDALVAYNVANGAQTPGAIGQLIKGLGAPGALSALMVPTEFVQTYYVNAAAAATSNNIYATIAAARAQAQTDIRADASGLAADEGRAYRWRRILVAPGTYNETYQTLPHVALIGDVADPADCRMWSVGTASPGSGAVLNTSGYTCYVANMMFEHTGTSEFWHAHRDAGPDNSAAAKYRYRTVVLDNVRLKSSDTAKVDSCPSDMTPGPNTFMVWNRCTVIGETVPQSINLVLNNGPVGSADLPSTFLFNDVTVTSNHSTWIQNAVNPFDVNGLANVVGMVDFGNSRADRVVWVGGKFNTGTAQFSGPTGRAPAGDIWTYSTDVTPAPVWVIDASVASVHIDGTTATNVTRVLSLKEVPVGGRCAAERRFLGTDQRDEQRAGPPKITTGLTPAMAALTANRIYYLRVPVHRAMHLGRMSLDVGTPAGASVVLGWYGDLDGTIDTLASNFNRFEKMAVVAGQNVTKPPGFLRHPVFPGDGYVWLVCSVSTASATVATSTDQSDIKVYYDSATTWNGTDAALPVPGTITALAGGTAFPLPVLWPDIIDPDTGDQMGAGTPYGQITPTVIGQRYRDLLAIRGAALWASVATGANDWNVLLGDTGEVTLPSSVFPATATGTAKARRVGGLVTYTITMSAWATGFTAPVGAGLVGLRPAASSYHAVMNSNNGATLGLVAINTDGSITLVMAGAVGSGGDARVSFTVQAAAPWMA